MSIASTPLPTPHELFGPARTLERAKQVHAQAAEAVLAQCRERLRRGVSPVSVSVFLRSQYVLRLAPLAAGLEVLADATFDEQPPHDPPVTTAAARVGAGTVRYAPFGNAAPRPVSRKKARA